MTDERPTHLDLFSGIGGFALAAQCAGFRTIGFCEIEKYCQNVVTKNFSNSIGKRCDAGRVQVSGKENEEPSRETTCGSGQTVADASAIACCSNIFDLDGRRFAGVNLITGGFPCQPFSCAGKRRGTADDRDLWPEMFRVIKEAKPDWVVGENVAGIETMEFQRHAVEVAGQTSLGGDQEEVHIYCESTLVLDARIRKDLESIGYEVALFAIPACAVDARHRRMRIWIVANSKRDGLAGGAGRGKNRKRSGMGAMGEGWKDNSMPTQESGSYVPDTGSRDGRSRRQGRSQHSSEGLQQSFGSHAVVPDSKRRRRKQRDAGERDVPKPDSSGDDADSAGERFQGIGSEGQQESGAYGEAQLPVRDSSDGAVWSAQPRVGGMVDGLPEGLDEGYCQWQEEDPEIPRVVTSIDDRVARLKGLGNAIVPQCAYEILREIRKLI